MGASHIDLANAKAQYESAEYSGEQLMVRGPGFFNLAAVMFGHPDTRLMGELLLQGYTKAERQAIYKAEEEKVNGNREGEGSS